MVPFTSQAIKTVSAAATGRFSTFQDEHSLCQVSYSSTDSMHRPMPAAARSAFKALERDTNAAVARSRVASSATAAASPAADSAVDTLCLVTYSDDEDASASWQQQQDRIKSLFSGKMLAAAAAATAKAHPGKAGAVFAALCSEDHTEDGPADLPGVMETLCILSYDEESA